MNAQSDTPLTDALVDSLNDEWDVEMAAITTHARKLERERNARFTVEEIADYLAGWTLAPFDEVAALGARVAHNALNQLRDSQDGIAAVRERKKLQS